MFLLQLLGSFDFQPCLCIARATMAHPMTDLLLLQASLLALAVILPMVIRSVWL